METKTKQLETQKVQQKNGSGSLLAEARKKQKKTVEEIADELNLSVTQIKTIELDQNEGLPEPTYVRGYIRSYAKLLGLDAERVLESYLNPNWQKTSSLDDMPKGIGNADDGSSSFLSPGKLIGVLFVVLIIAFLWFSGLLSGFVISGVPSAGDGVVPQVESSENNISDQVVEQERSVVELLAGQDDSITEPIEDPLATIESSVVDDEEHDKDTYSLTLTFIQTCWVDIRDTNDKRLAFKSYSAGEELNVTNEQRLHVFLGNAEGVTATYNGEPFDMTPYREGVYAKFTLVKE